MYAVVKTGGRQYRVAVGDVFEVEKISAKPGESVALETLLLVKDGAITHGAAAKKLQVTAEVVEHVKGPKIRIHKFKNKTGYHKRQGHRQPLTTIKVTDIASGKK